MIMKRILIYIISILVIGLGNIYSVEGKIRLAILDLDPVGVDNVTALTVSDLLRTELFNTGLFMVIERQQMTSILKEQEYQMSGCTSTECAVQIGRLLSANKILVGTVNKLGKSFIINARIVNVETGTMEFGDKAKVSSLDELDKGCEIFARKLAARIRGTEIEEEEEEEEREEVEVKEEEKEEEEIIPADREQNRKLNNFLHAAILSLSGGIGSFILSRDNYSKYEESDNLDDIASYKEKTYQYDALTYSLTGAGLSCSSVYVTSKYLLRNKFSYTGWIFVNNVILTSEMLTSFLLSQIYYDKYEKETEPEQINALKSTTIVFDRTTYILATFSMAGWLDYLSYKFKIKNRLLYSGITYAVTAGLFFYLGQKSYNDYKDSAVPEDVENYKIRTNDYDLLGITSAAVSGYHIALFLVNKFIYRGDKEIGYLNKNVSLNLAACNESKALGLTLRF